jgi:Leucine-rich repeat (LRR) protein
MLTGCFGSRTLTHDSGTKRLDLHNRELRAIPDSIFQMKHLEYLHLGNDVVLYPPLSALKNSEPETHANRIENLPEEISTLHNLKVLNLSGIGLRSLPPGFEKLQQLDSLDLSFNPDLELSNIKNQLATLRSLHYLEIEGIKQDSGSLAELRKKLTGVRIVDNIDGVLKLTKEISVKIDSLVSSGEVQKTKNH